MTNETIIERTQKQRQRARRYELPGLAEQVAYIVEVPDRPELRTIFGSMPDAIEFAQKAHAAGAASVQIAAEYSARYDILTIGGRTK